MLQQETQIASQNNFHGRVPDSTCLIVEDSEFDSIKMTRVINRSVNSMGVKVATTLQSAREALSEGGLSLILLDNNLPDGFGADFVQELARDKQLALIPVIMVSDWPSPFMWEKAASAGVHYVLNKAEFNARYVLSALEKGKKRRDRLN